MSKRRRGVSRDLQNGWYQRHINSISDPGNGTYIPYWRVEDINSSGIKVKIPAFNNPSRIVHLLSINELFAYMIVSWDPSIVEVYEQFALPLDTTLAIAERLEVKHPVHLDTRIPAVQTIDFMCVRDDGSMVAHPVKELSATTNYRTNQKLAIQESYCVINDIDYELFTSNMLKTELARNLERLYRHASLDPAFKNIFNIWLSNFLGILADDRHERTSTILEQSSHVTGVPYAKAAHFFYHALWSGHLVFDWQCPLYLEFAASDLGIYPNAG